MIRVAAGASPAFPVRRATEVAGPEAGRSPVVNAVRATAVAVPANGFQRGECFVGSERV